jgi:hypothetical protein
MIRTTSLLILLCFYSVSSAQYPTQGLVANYSLNGNAYDASGNGFHGKIIRARPTEDRFGNLNGALFFDGRSSYVRLGNILNSVFCAPVAKFTIMGWAMTQSYPNYQGGGVIISKSAGGTYGPYQWSLDHDNDGKIKWFVSSSSDASDYVEIESSIIPTDQWFHFAAVFDGSQQASSRMRLYVDGVSGSPSRRIGVLGTRTEATDQEITLGAGHHADRPDSPNNNYCGAIDDIRIYDRVLSMTEISSCLLAGNWAPPTPPKPTITAESPAFVRAGEEFWVELNATDLPTSTNIVNIGFDVIYTNTEIVDFVGANASSSLLGPELLYLATPNEAKGRVSVGLSRKEGDEEPQDGQLLIRLKFRIAKNASDNSSVTFILANISASDNEGTSLRFADRSSTTMIRAGARR